MKNEFENNLTEPFAEDDLNIRASMEGIEPEAGARERMLQNIMKKAAAAQTAEDVAGGVAESLNAEAAEEPRAEILSIGAAGETAKKNGSKRKNRWKLYIPMIAAAALIVTVGTIFFAVVGIEKMSGSKGAERDERSAYEREEDGKDANAGGHEAQDGGDGDTGAAPEIPNDVPVHEDIPTGQAEIPVTQEPMDPTGKKGEDQALTTMDPDPRSSGEWIHVDGNDAVTVTYEGHAYQLQYLENGQMEVPYDPETEMVTAEENITLWISKKTQIVQMAEWGANETGWYYLWNSDDASLEDVLAVIGKMQENCRESK